MRVSNIFKFKWLAVFTILVLLSGYSQGHAKHYVSLKQEKVKDSVIKILAIGNSFSDDAVEHYLYGLAKAGGYKVIIGNLYIAGAPLELHWANAQADKEVYNYRKINLDGEKTKTPNVSISKAIADENWDYISLQQSSSFSGMYPTYQKHLPLVYNYVKSLTTNANVKYILHQTWAYAPNSTHKAFINYHNNQLEMYKAIAKSSKKALKLVPFNLLIPAGTAIQNARTSFLGTNLTRDGYHLDYNIGRYIAACTWYEAIFKQSVIGNSYGPEKCSSKEINIAQIAAHKANKKKFKITKLSK